MSAESVLDFHIYVGPGIELRRLHSMQFYLLSHLTGPVFETMLASTHDRPASGLWPQCWL